jgi:hypothetical protein
MRRHREMPPASPIHIMAGAAAPLATLKAVRAQERIQVFEPDMAGIPLDLLSPLVRPPHAPLAPTI